MKKFMLFFGFFCLSAIADKKSDSSEKAKREPASTSFTVEEVKSGDSGSVHFSAYFKITDTVENVVCYGAKGGADGGRAITCLPRKEK